MKTLGLIDEGGTVTPAGQVQVWLADKLEYVVEFLLKMLPQEKPYCLEQPLRGGNILLRYEDLGCCHQLLQALGCGDLDEAMLPAIAPRHQQVLKRRAARVTDLIEANHMLLVQAEAEVMAAVPGMAALYPANVISS